MRRRGREKGNRETTESENVSFDGHDDLVPTHHWRTDYEINTKQTAILSLYRILRTYSKRGSNVPRRMDIGEPR